MPSALRTASNPGVAPSRRGDAQPDDAFDGTPLSPPPVPRTVSFAEIQPASPAKRVTAKVAQQTMTTSLHGCAVYIVTMSATSIQYIAAFVP